MKLLILTNILTPYRTYFYDVLNSTIKQKGGQLKVVVLSETEPNRNWNYDYYKRDYTILTESYSVNLKGDIFIHIPKNIDEIIINYKPDKVIVGGSYINPAINRIVRLKNTLNYDLLFWSESHLNEIKGYNNLKKVLRNKVRKFFISKFNSFCVPGELAKEYIEEYSPNSKYYLLPNLIDYKRFSEAYFKRNEQKEILRKKFNVSTARFIFILPARLSPVKGVKEFLELYNKCKNKDESIILIAGTGQLKKEIEDFSKENNLNVILLGSMSEQEMVELYTLADCLLLPSLSDPNPLSCIEALWSGLPLCVSNRVGNYPEVILENENGFVFSFEDDETSIEIIEELINKDRSWRLNASQVSRKIAQEKFLTENVIDIFLEELYGRRKCEN